MRDGWKTAAKVPPRHTCRRGNLPSTASVFGRAPLRASGKDAPGAQPASRQLNLSQGKFMKQPTSLRPAQGKLGVLLPGMGAVATTFTAGSQLARKGKALPIGSLTQMSTI